MRTDYKRWKYDSEIQKHRWNAWFYTIGTCLHFLLLAASDLFWLNFMIVTVGLAHWLFAWVMVQMYWDTIRDKVHFEMTLEG